MDGKLYGDVQAINSTLHLGDVYHITSQGRLKTVSQAIFNAYGQTHTSCHPATRKDLLAQIKIWVQQPDNEGIFWLNGMAGTGKSTISYTIAQWLTQQEHHGQISLGASFFFKRGEGDRASAALFFPTVVHQLRLKMSQLHPLVENAIDRDPDICAKSIAEQFEKLLKEPLLRLDPHLRYPVYVVVVDALDECESEGDIQTLLQLWLELSRITKVRIRLFLTSRPELPIRMAFADMPARDHHDIILHELPRPIIEQDIRIFLKDKLATIRERYNRCLPRSAPITLSWPGEQILDTLTTIATPLFIIAATICRFIQDDKFPTRYDPQRRLEIILRARGPHKLSKVGQIYHLVLTQIVPTLDDMVEDEDHLTDVQVHEKFQSVVGSIVTLAEPLSMDSLAVLLSQDLHSIETCLSPLHSVLGVALAADAPIRPLHLSFGEYLCSEQVTDRRFHVDRVATHRHLLARCLHLLAGLHENMCDLASPGQLRSEVGADTINERFSPALRYACRYWTHHTQFGTSSEVLAFLREHFLHWLEALSLLGCLSNIIDYLDELQSATWSNDDFDATAFLHDARRFVLANRYVIEITPLQAYSSAIVFAPQTSIIRNFCGQVPGWIQQCPITPTTWSFELQKLEGHTKRVNAVAFSCDGLLLASASEDSTIRLWKVSTGQEVQLLSSPTRLVKALAFSPDGLHLASLSKHNLVKLWNYKTGQQVRVMYIDAVAEDVVFSPDGSLLAIKLRHDVVRLWRLKAHGEAQDLRMDNCRIHAIGFLSDDLNVAVSSRRPSRPNLIIPRRSTPGTSQIRRWRCRDGQYSGGSLWHRPYKASTAEVFSFDGSLLATSSKKGKIQIWSMGRGMEEIDGTNMEEIEAYILRTDEEDWDEIDETDEEINETDEEEINETGEAIKTTDVEEMEETEQEEMIAVRTAETFQCQATMMALSPDGSFLAFVSKVDDIWLWDLRERQYEKVQILRGHADSVTSIVFSPNGLLASASKDHTVWLWDPKTDTETENWENLPKPVKAVAFSADGHLLGSVSESDDVSTSDAMSESDDDHISLRHPKKGDDMFLWDPKTGKEIWTTSSICKNSAVNFSPDGSLLIPALGGVRLWNMRTGEERQLPKSTKNYRRMSYSADGALAVWTDFSGLWVQSRDARGCRSLLVKKDIAWTGHAWAVAHDGSLLAVLSRSKTRRSSRNEGVIQLWDPEIGRKIRNLYGPDCRIDTMKFSPNNLQLALASDMGYILLWKIRTDKEVQRLEVYDQSRIEDIVFSPDGLLLASISQNGNVQLWDLKIGQRILQMADDIGNIREISFSADSTALVAECGRICAGGRDNTDQVFKTDDSRTLVLRHDWIEQGGKRILWLPVEYRSNVLAFHGNTFAIGRRSGQVSFLTIQSP